VFRKLVINRPVFAAVLSVAILLAVGLAVFAVLAVRHYLQAPLPTVEVTAVYPGASARVLTDTVAPPIEQEVYGVEDMVSMSRQCTDDGVYRLTITFRRGTDINIAQVLVQNRVNLALPKLPAGVQKDGISVIKQLPSSTP
jgi:multidrug efflux pump